MNFDMNQMISEMNNMNINNDFSSMQTLNHQLSSLFLGDLSIYSTEKDIRELFRNYGVIEQVRIKRGGSGKPHLSYGFIKFRTRESAELAMKEMNGTMFLGRALRIGWAEPKSNTKVIKPRNTAKLSETAQIHVSFISKQVDALITEETLRGLFSMYGEVVDVAIKKTQFDRKLRIQNGYGFVHFALTPEGIQSALTATKAIHQVTIDRVTYDCSLSHILENIVGPEVAAEIYAPKPASASSFTMEAMALASANANANQNFLKMISQNNSNNNNSNMMMGGGFGAISVGIPRPPPITTQVHAANSVTQQGTTPTHGATMMMNQQLPPLPPSHHHGGSGDRSPHPLHSPHYNPHHDRHSGGGGAGGAGLAFPHAELEKKGLHNMYLPSSGLSPTSASLMHAYYSGLNNSGSNNNNNPNEDREFYGIADGNMKKSPRLPVSAEAYYSTYNNNNDNSNSYSNRSSISSNAGGGGGYRYSMSSTTSSSQNSVSSYNDNLALSDTSSEAGPFERLSISSSRGASSKPSPTNSMSNRTSIGTSNSLSFGGSSMDRSPTYAQYQQQQQQQHLIHSYQSGSGYNSSSNTSILLGSSSLDSSLSLSTMGSLRIDVPTAPSTAPGINNNTHTNTNLMGAMFSPNHQGGLNSPHHSPWDN